MDTQILNIIQDFVNDSKKILKDNLLEQYLFGSYAKNEQNEWSDIDILLIVKYFNPEIRRKISALSSDYSLNTNVIISPVIKDIDVWRKNEKYNTLFYNEIKRYGIRL